MSDISIIVRKMRVYAEHQPAANGLGFPEQVMLMHLKSRGSSNQEAIATALDIDKGAVAKTVAKLEAKGLVAREVNPNNKREKLVTMQPAAYELLSNMMSSYQELEAKMFAGITDDQKAQMLEAIAIAARNVSDIDTDSNHQEN